MDVFTEVDVELIHTHKQDVAVYSCNECNHRRCNNDHLSRSSSQVHRPRPVELSEGLLSHRHQTDRPESYDEKTSSRSLSTQKSKVNTWAGLVHETSKNAIIANIHCNHFRNTVTSEQ